jgi:hypothetical protein
MKRKVLLLEPNYRNKYPPMGLMKLATYFRVRGDDVRFFKGEIRDLGTELLFDVFWKNARNNSLGEYTDSIRQFIRTGKLSLLSEIPNTINENDLLNVKKRYKRKEYPQFEIVGVTTLFSFYWKQTIDTIIMAMDFVANNGKFLIGGIASSIMPEQLLKDIGVLSYKKYFEGKKCKKIVGQIEKGDKIIDVHLYIGLLDKKGIIDKEDKTIIDELPLDYSILEEINYTYPANNAYFGYMTRGCINKCKFCSVHKLEPVFCPYVSIIKQIKKTKERFGEQRNLLLLDNNVLASKYFGEIIDEIKKCGFEKNTLHKPVNIYEIALKNIKDKYNERAYTKKMISIYDEIAGVLPEIEQGNFYNNRENLGLLYVDTATSKDILLFDKIAGTIINQYFLQKINVSRGQKRYIDFNQGVDARLISEAKIKKLAEININPLRIAFDKWDEIPKGKKQPMHEIYADAIKLAAKHGIRELSNYLLYNTDEDTPDELYHRLRLNIKLCEEYKVNIYSFPMKYHPIEEPNYFDNRSFTGKAGNRKYIRAVQAVLNALHGKIGRGKRFFEAAFGKNLAQFHEILLMPETFIIERYKYDNDAYREHLKNGGKETLTPEEIKKFGYKKKKWKNQYDALNKEQKKRINKIIHNNIFTDEIFAGVENDILEVLQYYRIRRL